MPERRLTRTRAAYTTKDEAIQALVEAAYLAVARNIPQAFTMAAPGAGVLPAEPDEQTLWGV